MEKSVLAQRFVRLLHCTGHYLGTARAPKCRVYVHLAAILLVIAISLYQVGWLFNNNVLKNHWFKCGINLFMLRFVIWTLKGIVVQIFFLHWQYRGTIELLLNELIRPKRSETTEKELMRRIRWICAVCVCAYLLLVTIGFGYFMLRQLQIVDQGYHFNYGALPQIVLRNVLWWHTMWLVTSSLIAYNVCTAVALADLDEFRECAEKMFGKSANQHLEEALKHLYERYLAIMKRIECLNDTFQVYLFAMLALNIPVTVSTLLRLWRSSAQGKGSQFLFIVPETGFCLFEIGALTVLAAQLEAKVKRIPKSFFLNIPLSAFCDGDTQWRVRAQITHLATNQPQLGITLWDFAVISKPLILTVVSVMVTYLTIVTQLLPEGHEAITVWRHPNVNSSVLC